MNPPSPPTPDPDQKQKSYELTPGERVKITLRDGEGCSVELLGEVLPSPPGYEDMLFLKLPSGYNIGISPGPAADVKTVDKSLSEERSGEIEGEIFPGRDDSQNEHEEIKAPTIHFSPLVEGRKSQKRIRVITTGGTVSSYVDYGTGGVTPGGDLGRLFDLIPEIEKEEVDFFPLFDLPSEDIGPEEWGKLADAVEEALREEAEGVIILHGTDTLPYSSAALAFAFPAPPVPVVITGAMRSPDRPSSDTRQNIFHSFFLAQHGPPGIYVVSHSGLSEGRSVILSPTRTKKLHTSRRDAFLQIGRESLGRIEGGTNSPVIIWGKEKTSMGIDYHGRSDVKAVKKADPGNEVNAGKSEEKKKERKRLRFHKGAALILSYPGISTQEVEAILKGKRGAILAGTGMGHAPQNILDTLTQFVDNGGFLGVVSQCIWGTVNLNVYSTGRKLLSAGATPLGDMLMETAYVKLSWALARTEDREELTELMLKNVAGEFSEKRDIWKERPW